MNHTLKAAASGRTPKSPSFPNGLTGNRSERQARRDQAIARQVEKAVLAGLPAREIEIGIEDTRQAFLMAYLIAPFMSEGR